MMSQVTQMITVICCRHANPRRLQQEIARVCCMKQGRERRVKPSESASSKQRNFSILRVTDSKLRIDLLSFPGTHVQLMHLA